MQSAPHQMQTCMMMNLEGLHAKRFSQQMACTMTHQFRGVPYEKRALPSKVISAMLRFLEEGPGRSSVAKEEDGPLQSM